MIKKILVYSYSIVLITMTSCSEDEATTALINEDDTTIGSTSSEIPNETTTNTSSSNERSITNEILALVNTHRQGLGLSTITSNATAEQLAIDHTLYMIAQRQIGHDNFNARFDTLKADENARGASENVASFYTDAQSVMRGWLTSEGHRENIEGDYTNVGIAAIKDNAGNYYYTQLFFR